MRPGARFGPAGIRDASLLLRPWNAAQAVDVFGALSLADLGDLHTTPGNAERTTEQIAAQLEPVLRAGATPITLGGDHSIVLGELRAHAAVHGPLGSCCSTPTPTRGSSTTASATSTGRRSSARWRRA